MASRPADLSRVTYLSVVPNKSDKIYQDIDSIIRIGENSSRGINFGKKIIYTYTEPTIDSLDFEIRIIDEIPYQEFNNKIFQIYCDSFDTDYVINFHSDGFIQCPDSWNDSFLDYDYLGAPISWEGQVFCGNGGFLRSKKICKRVNEIFESNKSNLKGIPEDVVVGYKLRDQLSVEGFKIGDLEIASKFSTEHKSTRGEYFYKSFGLHEIDRLYDLKLKEYRKRIQEKMI